MNIITRTLFAALVSLILPSLSLHAANVESKPNILVILTDDHGWADLGAQGVDADIRTPHLDKLARDGVRFTRGYVAAPQCVPSRAGLITGQHQNRFGVEDNLKGPLPLAVVTVPERLKQAGYVTGMSGKWHLDLTRTEDGQRQRVNPDFLPHAHGFDEYWCGAMRQYHASHDLLGRPIAGAPKVVRDDRFRITSQTEAALQFLERREARPEQRWFLYLSWFAPHVPLESPEPWFARTPTHLPKERRQALAMIAAMDDGLGQLREKIRAMGQETNTLIFFISDNGAPLKEGAWDGSLNRPLVGEKGMLTDGGVRVPFVAAWPGHLPAGRVYEHPVSTLDVGATAVALAGQPHDAGLDGVNLLPYLIGQSTAAPHESLYWRWRSQAAVLEFPWKLIHLGTEGRYLFNVNNPDGERTNLLAAHPEIAARLERKLETWCATLKPPGPAERRNAEDQKFFDAHVNPDVSTVTPATQPQPDRPNVILILADDLGWSDLGCYGGEIKTPALDRLAANGLRFTQFYNSAKCEPTRASLMSGQYWQDCGLGIKRGITMGQAMRTAGYATFAVGKWHLDGNPVERGFDRYFGHLSGASDYFKGNPSHRLDDQPFKPPTDGTFYTTDANADFAIQFLAESRRQHPEKPFFLYLAFNAPHGPLQAWPEDIAKYRGNYRAGWDKLREQRYQRMIELGMFKRDWALSPRPDTIPAWETLTEQEKDFEDLRMAIYAAMVDRMDQAIGRVLAKVKELGQEDNTLVMFLSDNGGSPYDRGRNGTLPNRNAHWEYGLGWAHLSNTPFQHYKRNMFNGGACTPFIANWPKGIKPRGTVTDRPAHIIDLMATLVDVAGWPWPKELEGKPLAALAGRSLRPMFTGETTPRGPLYFHLMDHRAVIAGDWKLVSDWGRPWELFDLTADRTELHDLSKVEPERFEELEQLWSAWWAGKNPNLLKAAGGEPRYRHLDDKTERTQGGNDEPDQARPAARQMRRAASNPSPNP